MPLIKPFFQVILWCMEAGLVNQWKVRTWARMKAEEEDVLVKDEDASTIVTLYDLQSAFFLYIIMIFFACFIFCVEMFCKLKEKRGNRVFKFNP